MMSKETSYERLGLWVLLLLGGRVQINDSIEIILPALPHEPLERV